MTEPEPQERPGRPKAVVLWLRERLWPTGIVVIALLAFALGYWAAPRRHPPGGTGVPPVRTGKMPVPPAARILYWSCSMHPQVKAPQQGKCPLCFMDLVPVRETAGDAGEGPRLVLSGAARELAEIQTSPVVYRPLTVAIRMVGKIEYDETRLAQVAAWVPGRIDRLYVDYVGMRVRKGDHLVYLYSPELRTAQEEFLIALRRLRAAQQGGNADDIASAQAIRDATAKKLELWGILPAQIAELEKSRRTDDHMTIHAPVGGTVIARDAYEGRYVAAGDRLFAIADLTAVWALLDAYEMDLGWLRYGQTVQFETDAYPGETFRGRVAFIQPVLNEMTRTVKVRVNVPNAGERLRPGMFVRAKLDVTLDEAGRVKEPDLAGKWMCPMHPEIVKDQSGTCDRCGMALEEATTLGFAKPQAPAAKALSIPATAPLLTGTRAVVYVEQSKGDQTAYVGREIELGPRAGDFYIVRSGLDEGERVVTRGNFKIDAALQIQAKPSMMKPQEAEGTRGEGRGEEKPHAQREPVAEMQPAIEAYVALTDALAGDDAAKAAAALAALKDALATEKGPGTASEKVPGPFSGLVDALREALAGEPPRDIAAQRKLLSVLTAPMLEYLRAFGHRSDAALFEAFCPMAFGNAGATWVQRGKEIRNPYFGAQMLRCGDVRAEFRPAAQGGDR